MLVEMVNCNFSYKKIRCEITGHLTASLVDSLTKPTEETENTTNE